MLYHDLTCCLRNCRASGFFARDLRGARDIDGPAYMIAHAGTHSPDSIIGRTSTVENIDAHQ